MTRLPKEEESQTIGKLAGRAFCASIPLSWIEQPLDGDSDYGIDYLIQLKDENNYVLGSFFLQLKGTTSPRFVGNGEEISYSFDVKTINYYKQQETIVMVALVDLSNDMTAKEAPVCYRWLDEAFLEDLTKNVKAGQDKITVRVPVESVVHHELDILPYFLDRLQKRDPLNRIKRVFEEGSDNPVGDLNKTAEAFKERPVYFDTLKDNSGAPWVNNPREHNSGRLEQIEIDIESNRVVKAEGILDELEGNDNLTDHEAAELYYQKCNVAILRGKYEKALEYASLAREKMHTSRYNCAYFESILKTIDFDDKQKLTEIISEINVDGKREASLKARCYVLMGDFSSAEVLLGEYRNDGSVIDWLLLFTIAGDRERFYQEVRKAKLNKLNDKQKILFHCMAARQFFNDGITTEEKGTNDTVIPARGRREYDYDKLEIAYRHTREAFKLAKQCGYPFNIYVILDLAVAIYSFYHDDDELIEVFEEILSGRPGAKLVVSAICPLLINKRRYGEVVDYVESVDELDSELISYLINAKYNLDQNRAVIDLVDKYKSQLKSEKPQNYDVIFCLAADSAEILLEQKKETEYLNDLEGTERSRELISTYEYLRGCKNHPDQTADYIQRLYDEYVELERPSSIAQQLLNDLDPGDSEFVEKIPELAADIQVHRELFSDESLKLAMSYANLQRWKDLLSLCEDVQSRYELDPLWCLLKASALHEIGDSGSAMEILDGEVTSDFHSVQRAENYVNLCVKLGFYEEAEKKLEGMLEHSPKDKKLKVYEGLMYIYAADENPSIKLKAALSKYGGLVDRNNEAQEGKFLYLFLIFSRYFEAFQSDFIEEVRTRFEEYFNNFPEPTVIKRATFPKGVGGAQVFQILQSLTGISSKQQSLREKYRNQIRRRALPVPYAMLHIFLNDVPDIFGSWFFQKLFAVSRPEYRLYYNGGALPDFLSDEYIKPSFGEEERSIRNLEVVFDETVLLVLAETDYLDFVLSKMDRITLRFETYQLYSYSSHLTMGSVYSSIPRKILRVLKKYFSNIRILKTSDESNQIVDSYCRLLERERHTILCSDDLYLSKYIESAGHHSISSSGLMDILQTTGELTIKKKMEFKERLCDLGIEGVPISFDELIMSAYKYNYSKEQLLLSKSEFYKVFLSYIERMDDEDACRHLCVLFSELLNETLGDIDIDKLRPLLDLFMIQVGSMSRLEFITRWFVVTCANTKKIGYSPMQNYSLPHSKLLRLATRCTVEYGFEYSMEMLLRKISELMVSKGPSQSSKLYEIIQMAFVDGSRESELFSSIYTDVVMNARIDEAES
ncbi:DUF4365 domain-containing protein [Saccharospirillum alexandrii]|uniref:DUF4365 domain-containing protein n=1 Tax=Saccharospirillum alexandrii TaxID=2448477 RepID=UPI0013E0B53C|nr:DUF4365 domain-containing protein [Saccharospirillum alexandrii]